MDATVNVGAVVIAAAVHFALTLMLAALAVSALAVLLRTSSLTGSRRGGGGTSSSGSGAPVTSTSGTPPEPSIVTKAPRPSHAGRRSPWRKRAYRATVRRTAECCG